jgi:hypothetical protein
VYITSFIHRSQLLDIAERWFCGRAEPPDALSLTKILISDGFVAGETLESFAREWLGIVSDQPFRAVRIRSKGELRDAICQCRRYINGRVGELVGLYQKNPDYFYRETPINGVLYIDGQEQLIGLCRLKRPKRIAEKANRRIAHWIFKSVQAKARRMAERRAAVYGVPLDLLLTSPHEMVSEFVAAEEEIARSFREGTVKFDRSQITINDVAGMKILGNAENLSRIESALAADPAVRVIEREEFDGDYRGISLILEIPWDPEHVCRRYRDSASWEKYRNRGVDDGALRNGLEPLLGGAEPNIRIELILATVRDMVESELGASIHEERIISQRDIKVYNGYIPINVEFLLEYLFSVGFSPEVNVGPPPIKLWGRYLPDTLVTYIRRLYNLPEYDLLY